MTITTYAELQTEIGTWLIRDDLAAYAPTFIQLAEAQIERKLRHRKMEKRATADLDARYTELPDDFLQPIRLHVQGEGPLNLTAADDLQTMRDKSEDTAGVPCYYNIIGDEIEVYPTPSDAYTLEMSYYRTLPNLSDANTSNWLLETSPDVYLYGALMQTAPFLAEDSRLPVWGALFQSALDDLNVESERSKWGGGGLKLRINK